MWPQRPQQPTNWNLLTEPDLLPSRGQARQAYEPNCRSEKGRATLHEWNSAAPRGVLLIISRKRRCFIQSQAGLRGLSGDGGIASQYRTSEAPVKSFPGPGLLIPIHPPPPPPATLWVPLSPPCNEYWGARYTSGPCFVLFSLQLSVCLWWYDYRTGCFWALPGC